MKTEGLIELMIVLAVIVFAAVLMIIGPRSTASRDACMKNLKQMDSSKASWALEQESRSTNLASANSASITNPVLDTNYGFVVDAWSGTTSLSNTNLTTSRQ